MKALGRGSLAAWIKVALDVASFALWAGAAGLCLAALAYFGFIAGAQWGWIDAPTQATGAGMRMRIDPPQVALPAMLSAAVFIIGGLVIVGRLKKLFESFTSGEPFRNENADHLRAIWMALAVMELARMAVTALTQGIISVLGQPGELSVRIDFNIQVSTWVAILILIVLAEVFREGARLREEQDLTI